MNGRRIAIAILFTAGIMLFFLLDLRQYLSLESLKGNRQLLQTYYSNHAAATVACFMAVYILQTALSLPGAAILSLTAGAIFGPVMGTVYACAAAAIGATLSFLATRYLLCDMVLKRFGDKLEGMNRELEERGFNYLLFLRLIPVFPFFLINLAAGLTRLPLRSFCLATIIGIVPGGFVFVNAGASLATVDSLSGVASPRVMWSFALLGLFALIPALYKRFRKY